MIVNVTIGIEFDDNERYILLETIFKLELTRLRMKIGLADTYYHGLLGVVNALYIYGCFRRSE